MPRSKLQKKLDAEHRKRHAAAVERKRAEEQPEEQPETLTGKAVKGIKSGGRVIAKGVGAAAAQIGSVFGKKKPTAKGYTSEIKLRL